MSTCNWVFVEKLLTAALATDSPSTHRKIYDMVIEHLSDHNTLTAQEIIIGITKGKMCCIKEFKSRTGLGVVDSENMVENYFKQNKIPFCGGYEIIV